MSASSIEVATETQETSPETQPTRCWWVRIKRWSREPLLHFLLIGALLFAIYSWMNRGRMAIEPSRQIAVTLDDLRVMESYFESQWHRPPTPVEFQAMVEDKIREEVLYREGLAMGLDKDDTIVKRRMAQKVQFLSEDVAAAHEPSSTELKAWFDRNTQKFALPSRYSFRHIYFSPDKRGENVQSDAAQALKQITGQPEHSNLAASLSDNFMFQDYYADRAPSAISKEFGPQFAAALEKLKPGSWQGPVESGYGWHLVFVDTVIPGRIPAFEEVQPEVKTAWLADQKSTAWQKAYADMRAKYTVLLPAVPSEAAQVSAVPQSPPDKKRVPAASGEGPL